MEKTKLTQKLFDQKVDGILFFYEFMELKDLYKVFKKFFKSLTYDEFRAFLFKNKIEEWVVSRGKKEFITSGFMDEDSLEEYYQQTNNIPIFIFDDIDEYEKYLDDWKYRIDSCPAALDLVNFLDKLNKCEITYDLVSDEILEMNYKGGFVDTLYGFSHELVERGYWINNLQQLQELYKLLYNLYANARLSSNKGWTNKELVDMGCNVIELEFEESKLNFDFLKKVIWHMDNKTNNKRPCLLFLAKVINGLVNLYGVIDEDNLFKAIIKFFPHYEFSNFLNDLNKIKKDEDFTNPYAFNFKIKVCNNILITYHNQLDSNNIRDDLLFLYQPENIQYHQFNTLKECISYGINKWAIIYKPYHKLFDLLCLNHRFDDHDWIYAYDALIGAMQSGLQPTFIISMMLNVRKDVKFNEKTFQILNEAYENTRLWIYKGNTIKELLSSPNKISEAQFNCDYHIFNPNRFDPFVLLKDLNNLKNELEIANYDIIKSRLEKITSKQYKS